jgi:hypothetical protein
MIAVFDISQQISSDCLQSKFPVFRICKAQKSIQMFQVGRQFNSFLVDGSKHIKLYANWVRL